MRRHVTLLLLLIFLLTGCGASGESISSEPALDNGGGMEAPMGSDAGEAARLAPAPGPEGAPMDAQEDTSDTADIARERTIRRSMLVLEVDDLSFAAQQARDVALGLGGYVSDETVSLDGNIPGELYLQDDFTDSSPAPVQPGTARITLQVPTDDMDEALTRLNKIGTEISRTSSETIVETALVDLESRVATQTRSVERVRELLTSATSLSDIVTIESELASREAELESLQAQRDSLQDQTRTASITVLLQVPGQEATSERDDTFLEGLRGSIDTFLASTLILVTFLSGLLPFLLVGGLVAWILRRVLRRHGKRAPRDKQRSAGQALQGTPGTPMPAPPVSHEHGSTTS